MIKKIPEETHIEFQELFPISERDIIISFYEEEDSDIYEISLYSLKCIIFQAIYPHRYCTMMGIDMPDGVPVLLTRGLDHFVTVTMRNPNNTFDEYIRYYCTSIIMRSHPLPKFICYAIVDALHYGINDIDIERIRMELSIDDRFDRCHNLHRAIRKEDIKNLKSII